MRLRWLQYLRDGRLNLLHSFHVADDLVVDNLATPKVTFIADETCGRRARVMRHLFVFLQIN